MNILKMSLQWLACLCSWLTISPLFFYLSKRWKLLGKKLRWGLLLTSPLFLCLYLMLCIAYFFYYYEYDRKYHFADNEVIENITGASLPKFKVVEYEKGGTSFNGDYDDTLIIEFTELPSYQHLDSLVSEKATTGWQKRENTYSFSIYWGNGIPAPKGEDDKKDRMFSIHIEKGSKRATIESGTW